MQTSSGGRIISAGDVAILLVNASNWDSLLSLFNGADGYNVMTTNLNDVTALESFLTSAPEASIEEINFNRLSEIELSNVIRLVRSVDVSDFSRLDAINGVRQRLQSIMVPDPIESDSEEESKTDDESKSDDGRYHRDRSYHIPGGTNRQAG